MGAPVRFVRTPTALADQHVRLEWEPEPSRDRLTWPEALASATITGWRLPSTFELMSFLEGLPYGSESIPAEGAVLWSATGLPFAPASFVRAVLCEPGRRFAVVLLEKAARAQRWGVRPASDT